MKKPILRIISKHDPEGLLYAGLNPRGWTEYALEAEAILPRLKHASSAAQVEKMLRQVFRRFFGTVSRKPRIATIYRKDRHGQFVKHRAEVQHDFATIANEIWNCIRRPQHKRALANVVDLKTPIEKVVSRIRKSSFRSNDKLRLALIAALDDQSSSLKAEPLFRQFSVEEP